MKKCSVIGKKSNGRNFGSFVKIFAPTWNHISRTKNEVERLSSIVRNIPFLGVGEKTSRNIHRYCISKRMY